MNKKHPVQFLDLAQPGSPCELLTALTISAESSSLRSPLQLFFAENRQSANCFHLGLLVVFHGKGEGIEHDGSKDGVLAGRGSGKGPQLVLDRVLRDVAPHWLCIQRKFDAVSLRMGDNFIRIQSL